jgi:hypothetical protein
VARKGSIFFFSFSLSSLVKSPIFRIFSMFYRFLLWLNNLR